MTLEPVIRDSLECLRVVEGRLEILIAQAIGPRIVGFRLLDGPQLFASLPGLGIERSGAAPYRFHGGHRLWAAPEVPATTYAPDDRPVAVASDARGISVLAPVDAAGLEKSMHLTLRGSAVIVDHTIVNAADDTITLAPWAITQFAVGGTAIIPLGSRLVDEFQAERSLVAWPYTSWSDPLITIGDEQVLIEAVRRDPLKLGTALRREWLGYRLENNLFVKRAAYPPTTPLVDLGATGQCYCNDEFLELETVGPLAALRHGETITHREVWEIFEVPSHTPLPRVAQDLGLDHRSPLLDVVA